MRPAIRFGRGDKNDRHQDLVLIGSPKSNPITKAALEALKQEGTLRCEFRESPNNPGRWEILFDDAHLESQGYDQLDRLLEEGKDAHDGPLEDYGLLAKVRNPWNRAATMLVVAGIRALGTWGAARHLAERATEVHEEVKDRNFLWIVKVTYSNWRIDRTDGTKHWSPC